MTDDTRLSELLSQAVSDLEPADRLADIRTRTKVAPMSSRRPWLFAVGGAVVATAATVTAIAYAGHLGSPSADDPGPVGHSTMPHQSACGPTPWASPVRPT